MSSRRATICVLACVASWGAVFVGVYKVLPELDPLQIVTLRFIGVSAFFATVLALQPALRPRPSRREVPLVLLAGVLAVAGSQLPIVDGQRFLSPPIAALIVTFAPAVAAVLAALVTRESLTALQVLGFAVGLAGVAIIVILGAGSGAQLEASNPLRASVALVSPICWAVYTLLAKPLAGRHPTIGIVGLALICGTAFMAPLVPHAVEGAQHLSANGWMWLAFLTAGGTALPYILWSMSLEVLAVNRTAAFMYLVPVFALMWTALILGNLPSLLAVAGGIVVLVGVALTQLTRPQPAPVPG